MTGVREQGSGTPLTLLHGISSGAASWHKQMALPGYRVLAWDMPGYGESPMLATARADAGAYADALARMLDRAGVQKTVLLGHSLGALVAAAFAARYPQRVRYLVLADVGGHDCLIVNAGGNGVNQAIVGKRVLLLRNGAGELPLQIGHQLQPFAARLRLDLRDQLRQHFANIALNRHVRLFDFTQLRAVDINVDNFRIRAELLGFTNRPVIKTRP